MDQNKNETAKRSLPVSFGPKPGDRKQAWKPTLFETGIMMVFVLLWWLVPELGTGLSVGNSHFTAGIMFGLLLMQIYINRRVIINLQDEISELRSQIGGTKSHNE